MMGTRFVFGQFGAATRRKETLVLCLALCTLGVALSANAQEREARFITLASHGTGSCPFAASECINPAGHLTPTPA
jgi:hypothetical protein